MSQALKDRDHFATYSLDAEKEGVFLAESTGLKR